MANEFFDAIPVKQFLKDGSHWYERFIKISANKKLSFEKKKINIINLEKKFNFNISNKQNFIEYSPLGLKYLKDILKIIKKDKGGLLIIDYGYFSETMRDTLKAIHKKNYSEVLENVGKSDITYNINFYLIDKIVRNLRKLDVSYTSQKRFLTNLGIHQRAEIISKNKTFSEKVDIFYRLKRLIDENEMGKLFKVMLIKNSDNKSRIGF